MDTADYVVDFYYRENCHLCERMQHDLERFLDRSGHRRHVRVTMKDIDDNKDWFTRFREYVPVLVLDGEEICYYFFDEESVSDALTPNSPFLEVIE